MWRRRGGIAGAAAVGDGGNSGRLGYGLMTREGGKEERKHDHGSRHG